MSEITAEMWEKAITELYKLYHCEDSYMEFIAGKLLNRYDHGERSVELYNAIIQLTQGENQ